VIAAAYLVPVAIAKCLVSPDLSQASTVRRLHELNRKRFVNIMIQKGNAKEIYTRIFDYTHIDTDTLWRQKRNAKYSYNGTYFCPKRSDLNCQIAGLTLPKTLPLSFQSEGFFLAM